MKKHLLLGILLFTLSLSSFSFAQNSQNYIESSVSFSKSLYRGLRDGQVKSLQDLLKEAGYFNDISTGFFGVKTEAAVKKFQSDNGIDSVGLVGKKTREVLNKKYIYKSSVDSLVQNNNITTATSISNNSSIDPAGYVDECNYIKGPYLKLISPNGGERYQAGQQITVKWKSCNIPTNTLLKITLSESLSSGAHTASMTVAQNTPNDGQETFILTNQQVSDYFAGPSGYPFKIEITTYGTGASADSSDNAFFIDAASSSTDECLYVKGPFIKVISPNGGETYQAGGNAYVKWKSCNISSDTKLQIALVYNGAGGGTAYDGYLHDDVNGNATFLNNGSANVTVPNATPWPAIPFTFGKYYKIKIITEDGREIQDDSDNLFTINQQSNITTDTTPRIAMWYGKVNQHTNSNGEWVTDPDGVSGAGNYSQWGSEGYGDRKLEYCKKFYPNTISVGDYKKEMINTWRERGNTGGPHTAEVMTTKCLDSRNSSAPSLLLFSPNGGENYVTGDKINIKWEGYNIDNYKPVSISMININSGDSISVGEEITANGNFSYEIPAAIVSGYYKIKISIKVDNNVYYTVTDTSDSPFKISNSRYDISNQYSLDTTSRIAYWWGKVNQHVDSNGNWVTDPDGTSGANLDQLTYCKKWYPNTISTQDYKRESISTWRAAGNTGSYTAEVMTVKCVK
jgi:hypothetical protein